jgi:circadian clock protein KaiB
VDKSLCTAICCHIIANLTGTYPKLTNHSNNRTSFSSKDNAVSGHTSRVQAQRNSEREYVLRLYTAGRGPNSERAKSQLEYICATYLSNACRIEYVDVWEHPKKAFDDHVFVTPALRKLAPGPPALILGNLSQTQQVLRALGIENTENIEDIEANAT